MPKLLMLKGLPASGKSTFAKQLVATEGYWRINKDDLRAMVHNGTHSKYKEKFIIHWRDEMIKDTLGGGTNVVVDDTNFNPIHKAHFQAICEVMKYDFEEMFFDVPAEECIRRDLQRPNSVGEKVIRDMYNQYLKPPTPIRQWNDLLPGAVICDIDGTLAHMKDRGPYDWDKVGGDEIDPAVSQLLRDISGQTIILLSGRDAVCLPQTEAWLQKHGVSYDELYMRPPGDMRKDSIVKREIFERYIEGRYNVLFMLDDRQQVVDMWRNDLGLKVFQVAEGNF